MSRSEGCETLLCDTAWWPDLGRNASEGATAAGLIAAGQLRWDSDVDLLLDFPEGEAAAAWDFAEDECARLGLDCDIRPLALCTPRFLDHVLPEAISSS